jgi:hypothetical protein
MNEKQAVKITDHAWVVAEHTPSGWTVLCRTLGHGVGDTPRGAVDDASRHGGFPRCAIYRTRCQAEQSI